ncbi:MAG TPA: aminoacyl-tRNA hydrolase [bacterium]|nr:aminoacyl-tRNA hydrolase [bacterium]
MRLSLFFKKHRDKQPPLLEPSERIMVVGLGNPGRRYAGTRHNWGFDVLETYLRGQQTTQTSEHQALVDRITENGRLIIVVLPQTYMNRSGTAVLPLLDRYQVPLSHLLIVHDDLDLPLGRIRLRGYGSSGGHRGVESVIQELGDNRFPRLRGGIGPCPNGMKAADFVLNPFSESEKPLVQQTIERASEAITSFIVQGLEKSMNLYNSLV